MCIRDIFLRLRNLSATYSNRQTNQWQGLNHVFLAPKSHQLTTLVNTDNWCVSLHLSNKINNKVCYWLDYNKLRLSHTHMTSIELCKGFVGLYVFCKYKICATWIIYQIHTIYNTQHMNNEFLNIGLVM